MKRSHQWFFVAVFALAGISASAAEAGKPIRALLIAGGCCHDYEHQKDILKKGLEERGNIQVDIVYAADNNRSPKLSIYGNPDYAKGYDVVIHDECAGAVTDPATVAAVLAPHRAGIPGVNLHCAMHSYGKGNGGKPLEPGTAPALWDEYLGLQSCAHGPQAPIAITFTDKEHPITKGLADWTTVNEEHYNNIKVFDTAHPLATGKQTVKGKDGKEKTTDWVVVWTSTYHNTRVFSTTIGHNNTTVSDPRYLDLLVRGITWAVGDKK